MNTSTTPDQATADEARFLAPETHQRAGGQSQEEEGDLRYIALDKLVLSPLNVRKSGGESIDELASLIASQGLLQNLVVVPHTTKKGKATGRFEVVAGGRRLRALIKLAQIGTVAPDEQVLCKVVSREAALATSAAENSGREPMSAADTVQAFADMVKGGATVEEISVCFGITPMTVRRRLKLAAVSPRLFGMFREGQIDLEQMMALAVSDDHTKQEAVWDGAQQWQRQPPSLRRALLGEAVPVTHSTVRFVGLGVYEAAGGAVVRDLFAERESDGAHIADRGLLDMLVNEKLAGIAAEVKAEGWAWTEARQSFEWKERDRFLQARPGRRAPTAEEEGRIEALTKRRDEATAAIEALYEEGEDGEGAEEGDDGEHEPARGFDGTGDDTREKEQALEQQVEEAEAELRELHAAMEAWTPGVMAHAGAVVSLGYGGEATVVRGLVKPEDRQEAAAAQTGSEREPADGEVADHDGRDGRYETPYGSARDLDAPVKAKPEYSEPLTRRLAAHRTKALQALLAENTRIALAVLAHAMVRQVIEDRALYRLDSSIDVVAKRCDLRLAQDADDLEASPAWQKLRAQIDGWGERLPGDADRLLSWLVGQQQETVLDLLAVCTAVTLNAGSGGETTGNASAIAGLVGLDMANWWTPTAVSFLSHVPKAKLVQVVQEAVSEGEAQKLGKLKKAEAVAKAEALLAGTRWLPVPLRTSTP